MIFNNYTKWLPVASYYFSAVNYIVMARVNKKTGMMYFRTKVITGNSYAPVKPDIEIGYMFNKLLELGEEK